MIWCDDGTQKRIVRSSQMGLLQAACLLYLRVHTTVPTFAQALPLCGGATDLTVANSADAVALATALRCSNGDFAVDWVGAVVVEETLHVTNSTTLNITGGAGALADGDSKIRLFTVDGGSSLHLRDMTLSHGNSSDGGAIYANESRISFSGISSFTRNTVVFEESSWYEYQPSGSSSDSPQLYVTTTFAGRGGAIYAASSTLSWDGGDVSFADNYAGSYGGAIWAWNSSVSFEGATTCEFIGNTGDTNNWITGGAIHADSSRLVWDGVDNTTFFNNSASEGGAMYVHASDVTWEAGETRFVDNFAENSGGAIWAGSCGSQSILNWKYDDDEPAPIIVYSNETTTWTSSSTSSSTSSCYGEDRSSVAWDGHMVFSNNGAMKAGGGMYLDGSGLDVLAGGSVVFSENKAGTAGGGILCIAAEFTVSGQASFTNNTADSGGGIGLFHDSSLTFAGTNVTISGNAALSNGGGIHAEASTQFVVERATFLGNSAGKTGGGLSLLSVGMAPTAAEPSARAAKVSACQFIGNDARDAGGAVAVAGGLGEFSNSRFDGNTAGRAGGAILMSGTARLKGCIFFGNRAPLGAAASNTASITLRNTEFESNNLLCDDLDGSMFLDWQTASAYESACHDCGGCTNCTTQNPNNALICEPVPEHSASLAADGTLETLDLAPGYWRNSRSSREIRECYEPDSCVGGTEEYCQTGYTGPFCAVCADGFTRGLGYTCSECNSSRRTIAIVVALILLAAAVVVAVLSGKYLRPSTEEPTVVRIQPNFVQARFENGRVLQGLKIILVSWQIVSQFSAAASVIYPSLYAKFVGYVDIVDLDLAWMLSVECWINTDFYDTLLTTTIGPQIVCGMVLASYVIRRRRHLTHGQGQLSEISRKHATFLYLVSFLVYSTVSSTIFQTFGCDDIEDGTSFFLRADHSIQCYTTEHKLYMAYAGVMCLVYPFGIPFCYAVILYRARTDLKSEVESVRVNATPLTALSAPYRADVYYYEVVECVRRVTLSGLVVFIMPNSAGQVMTSFLLSLFFFALFTVLDPYTNAWDTWMARIGHAIVMMSMFVALVVKVDVEGDDEFSQDVFAGALVVANCVMILTVVVEAFGVCSVVVRDIKEPVRPTSFSSGTGVEDFADKIHRVG